MKTIIISIRPEWACKILNGDKKIEVRKGLALYNALKRAEERGEEVEFLMYVTKAKPSLLLWTSKTKEKCRKAILQLDEAQADRELDEFMNYEFCVVKHPQYFGGKVYFEPTHLNGEVVARFKADFDVLEHFFFSTGLERYRCFGNSVSNANFGKELEGTCLHFDELDEYLEGVDSTALLIRDLEIFDKPKELSDFGHYCNAEYCNGAGEWVKGRRFIPLQRAPQSWCYAKK